MSQTCTDGDETNFPQHLQEEVLTPKKLLPVNSSESTTEFLTEATPDINLTVTKTVGGYHSHLTRLMRQLDTFLNSDDYSHAAKILDLQNRVKAAHHKFSESVKLFCDSLEDDSERNKEYLNQLNVSNSEILTAD